jgi:hypothetical protein
MMNMHPRPISGSRTCHTNQTTIRKRSCQVGLGKQRARVPGLNGPEGPEELEQRVGNLGEGELLTKADARASAEG